MDFVKVFDLAETGYRTWEPVGMGLRFLAIGGTLLVAPLFLRKLKVSYVGFEKKGYQAFSWIFFVFALLWTVGVFVSTFSGYRKFKDMLMSGSCNTVEGKVENFDPMPHSGHKHESFTVNGVNFAFSDYVVTGAFNNTKSHGGPITADSYVRICYAPEEGRNHILRLEIRGYKGPIKDYSSGTPLFPSTRSGDELPLTPDRDGKIHGRLSWYSYLFVYVFILDFIGVVYFNPKFLKISLPLRKAKLNVLLPAHLQKDTRQTLKNVVLKWDTSEAVIWGRPKGLNLFHILFMVTRWCLNREQNAIIKEEVRMSPGLPLGFIAMFICARGLVTGISRASKLPVELDGILLGFCIIGIVLNGWIFSKRMKNLSKKTMDGAFEASV
jgi:hypothetical protein